MGTIYLELTDIKIQTKHYYQTNDSIKVLISFSKIQSYAYQYNIDLYKYFLHTHSFSLLNKLCILYKNKQRVGHINKSLCRIGSLTFLANNFTPFA